MVLLCKLFQSTLVELLCNMVCKLLLHLSFICWSWAWRGQAAAWELMTTECWTVWTWLFSKLTVNLCKSPRNKKTPKSIQTKTATKTEIFVSSYRNEMQVSVAWASPGHCTQAAARVAFLRGKKENLMFQQVIQTCILVFVPW